MEIVKTPLPLALSSQSTADSSTIKDEKNSKIKDCLKVLIPIMSVIGGSLIGPVSNVVPCEGIFLK